METNDVVNKLKYLGLDLNKIPNIYQQFEPLNYRPSKIGDERTYKIYKYIDVNEIEILLTPTNRLCDISEKYSKAAPLYAYLEPNNEKNLERHLTFLKMLNTINYEKIDEIEKEQKELNKKVPFTVKYSKDYLWQIYYSESTDKYFMLVPTEDLDYSAFFYLLKTQLQNKNNKIFVPISYLDYDNNFLNRNEIEEIGEYLCFFTKEWPLVYEVYDKDGEMSLQISGETFVYDNIKSKYKIKINNKEDSEKFYKLLKALFILQTQLSHYYKFDVKIDYRGNLNFYKDNKKIIYEILSSIIKEEYIKAEDLLNESEKEKKKLEKKIKKLKRESLDLEQEFIEKEKQISTYLECKRTFFGRVKYFFKSKKSTKNIKSKEDKNEDKPEEKLEYIKYDEIKEHYTLEELVNIYKSIQQNQTAIKELNLDLIALTNRIKNINSKIKNATLYIEEIEKHKKSIFEFWKFTNKDKISELPEGTEKEIKGKRLKQVFNYELDFEKLSRNLDKRQREILSQEEINSIFVATTNIAKDINTVLDNGKITEKRLNEVKDMAEKERMLFNKENFDIFGAIESNNNAVKILSNKKHRETKRELFKILDITAKTNLEQYTEMINKIISSINFAIKRMNTNVDLNLYIAKDSLEKLNTFYIDSQKSIQDFITSNETEINLYKVKIKEDTPVIALSNIIYYYNTNKTLPLGMNESEQLLLNSDVLDLVEVKKDKFNIVTYEENDLSKIVLKKVNVIEYEVNKLNEKGE